MTEFDLLLNLAKAGSPWASLAVAVWKLSPFLKQMVELYAKYTVASEKQAEALKEIAAGVKLATTDISIVKQQLPTVCGYPASGERRAVNSGR